MRSCLIYATWNRAQLLERSLKRLSELTVPDEIIVVDDGSTDHTQQVCEEAYTRLGLPLRYLYNHRPYEAMCSQAKNVGVRSTDADVLLFSEPEMYLETDAVAQMLERHAQDQAQHHPPVKQFLNAGRILHEQGPGGVGTCRCCGRDKHETVNWQALWFSLFRREWLEDVRGWDEHFPDSWGWDDTDLGSRLRIRGVGQYNMLDVVATHQWHPTRFHDQTANETYFKTKGFHGAERPDHPMVFANPDGWGEVVPCE